jgi:superfamily II DNA or RNA helicase
MRAAAPAIQVRFRVSGDSVAKGTGCVNSVNKPPVTALVPDAADGAVQSWLTRLQQLRRERPALSRGPQLHYVLDITERYYVPHLDLSAFVATTLRTGTLGQSRRFEIGRLAQSTEKVVTPADRTIGRLVNVSGLLSGLSGSISPRILAALLEQLASTERLHWRSPENPALSPSPLTATHLAWRLDGDGRQRPCIEGRSTTHFLPANPVWYVDVATWEVGPVDLGIDPELAAQLVFSPALNDAQARLAKSMWHRIFDGSRTAPPHADSNARVIESDPVPVLELFGDPEDARVRLTFAYGERVVSGASSEAEFHVHESGVRKLWPRRHDAEWSAARTLSDLGFESATFGRRDDVYRMPVELESRWAGFMLRTIPRLRGEGWRVEIDSSFPFRVLAPEPDHWTASVTPNANRWFDLDLGIDVDGVRVPLLPILVRALHERGIASLGELKFALREDDELYARLAGNTFVALPKERLNLVLSTLIELFESDPLTHEGRLELSPAHLSALDELGRTFKTQWFEADALRSLVRAATGNLERTFELPSEFTATLRPYQRLGVAWLQQLAAQGFGGVLADDMGLGKTVQFLAHAAIERARAPLSAPILIVAPTSVEPNWRAEIARFTPHFKVVSLTGPDRAERFAHIDESDIVLTTYALLLRDTEHLLERAWSIAVLDEAQAIKNPRSKGAALARRINAVQRIALTGTPIENHLDELWSICAFAVPGLLGDHAKFARLFRTPIEKRGDAARRMVLGGRIQPFVLRRTKQLVEADLPEKTEIVQRIELLGAQRDLYETIRLAMRQRVRDEVARSGLARSHIVVLDALLKLRQICCDPRLLKLPAARDVHESQKLEALLEMLDNLVEDGRRILLFSQFTSMLDLMKPELTRRKIDFVELRGQTRDRVTPVQRFQAGEVPVFLISLKAGGTGLNLTAADTVIHYDPWWNPAVERQATDRAHRIGQHKPVFVYKLIAVGTVEERIMEMQARKAALAEQLFSDSASALQGMDVNEIERLFAPLDV